MNPVLPPNAIRLTVVEERGGEPYRLFIVTSLALAGLAGFVLGLHIPLGRLLDWQSEARRPDMIQAHGQVQLLGFAGLFVMGMSLRLMPRFSRTTLKFEGLVIPAWGLITGALVTKAFVMVWLPDTWHSSLAVGTQFSIFLGATAYFLVVIGTLLIDQQRVEGTGWLFLVGAFFLFLQGALGVYIAVQESGDDTRVFSYLPNMALLYLQVGGFLMAFVSGVALRAIPTMSGLARSESGTRAVACGLLISVLTLALPLVWLEYRGYADGLARLSDLGLAGFGITLLGVVWLSGVFRPAANRVRPASQPHMRLVRLAMAWFVFAGLLAVYAGGRAAIEGGLPSFLHLDALRHAIALGGLTSLIFGMAMMIVPEFAGERQASNAQSRAAAVLSLLVTAAAFLRVFPALAGTALDLDVRNGMMLTAGLCAEAALLYFALKFLRLMLRSRSLELPVFQQPVPAR